MWRIIDTSEVELDTLLNLFDANPDMILRALICYTAFNEDYWMDLLLVDHDTDYDGFMILDQWLMDYGSRLREQFDDVRGTAWWLGRIKVRRDNAFIEITRDDDQD